jgi:hypothetical protein
MNIHLAVRETNARTQGARQAALHSEQLVGPDPLLDQLAHLRHFFLRGRYICFAVLSTFLLASLDSPLNGRAIPISPSLARRFFLGAESQRRYYALFATA